MPLITQSESDMKKTTAPTTKGVGWDVFECDGSDDGDKQIQAIGSPDDFDFPAFDGDDQLAIQHVIHIAKRGDTEAIDALWEVLPHDGLINRMFWAEHFPHFDVAF